MSKRKSVFAQLYQQQSRLVEAGYYEITAVVPTGIDNQTVIVARTIRKISDKRWALLDSEGAILHTVASKRDAVITSDRLFDEMVRRAEQVGAERQSNPTLPPPIEPTAKVRYPFDRDTAHASLMEASPEYRIASLHHGDRMVDLLLADWYTDRRHTDMAVFARAWVTRRRDNGMEGHYPRAVATNTPAASEGPR